MSHLSSLVAAKKILVSSKSRVGTMYYISWSLHSCEQLLFLQLAGYRSSKPHFLLLVPTYVSFVSHRFQRILMNQPKNGQFMLSLFFDSARRYRRAKAVNNT